MKEFVEAVSDNEVDFDSDDDIVGEVVYDEEYLRKRKQRRRSSSSSEGDEEYNWDDENGEDEEEEEEEEEDLSISEESDEEPRKFKKLRGRGRTRRETKLRSVGEIQSGLRRSKRATRTRINYRQYEISESETESSKRGRPKLNESDEQSEASENEEYLEGSHDSDGNDDDDDNDQAMKVDQQSNHQPVEVNNNMETVEKEQSQPPEKSSSPGREEVEGVKQRRFLDLNELAPASGFDEGPNSIKDENTDNFQN